MSEKTIAQKAFELSSKGNIILPEGVAGKHFTTYSNGKPYVNSILFSDGSELTVGSDNSIYWNESGGWEKENPDSFKPPVLPPEA